MRDTELLDKIVKEFIAHPAIARAVVNQNASNAATAEVELFDFDDNRVAVANVGDNGLWVMTNVI